MLAPLSISRTYPAAILGQHFGVDHAEERAEALEAAQDLSEDGVIDAQLELQINNLRQKANQLFNQKHYQAAEEKYQEARKWELILWEGQRAGLFD